MAIEIKIDPVFLAGERVDYIVLPEKVRMFCPQCKMEVADENDCFVVPEKFPAVKDRAAVKLMIDCRRNCGCYGPEPVVAP